MDLMKEVAVANVSTAIDLIPTIIIVVTAFGGDLEAIHLDQKRHLFPVKSVEVDI